MLDTNTTSNEVHIRFFWNFVNVLICFVFFCIAVNVCFSYIVLKHCILYCSWFMSIYMWFKNKKEISLLIESIIEMNLLLILYESICFITHKQLYFIGQLKSLLRSIMKSANITITLIGYIFLLLYQNCFCYQSLIHFHSQDSFGCLVMLHFHSLEVIMNHDSLRNLLKFVSHCNQDPLVNMFIIHICSNYMYLFPFFAYKT